MGLYVPLLEFNRLMVIGLDKPKMFRGWPVGGVLALEGDDTLE